MRLASAQIANHSLSEANSLGLSGSASMGGSAAAKADAAKSGQVQAAAPTGPDSLNGMKLMDASATNNTAAPSAMAVSSNDSSVTQSGISGGTITVGQQSAQGLNSLNGLTRKVVSGTDSSGKIANNFNQADLQTTLTVASAFIQQAAPFAAKLVGDIGESKQKAADGLAESNLTLVKQALDKGNAEDAVHYQNLADQARANAASWGDNGSNRIALHTASQALIGGLSGGSAGALNSGSGALAGNLGQQLGESMAAAEAKRLGLNDTAAKTLASSYQQSLATIGGALGGLIAGSASGQNGAGSLVAAAQAGNTAMAVDLYNRQLHDKERQWAKENAKKYQQYLSNKTDKKISEEEAYQRLLSAGYAVVDDAAMKSGKSDELAKQFMAETKPKDLFVATAADRANPLLGGNADGSWTPEQQARFGAKNPTQWANQQLENAKGFVVKPCNTPLACDAKLNSIANVVEALAQEKMLYQNNPSKVKEIEQQQQALFIGLTQKEIEQAQLGAADKSTLFDALTLLSGPAMVKDFAGLIGKLRGGKGMVTVVDSGIAANNSGIAALGELSPVTPAASGGISATKMKNGYAIIDLTPAEQGLAKQVATQGDKGGVVTENLVESVGHRQGLTSLDGGKYRGGSNNGFDHVFQNLDGTVTILLDSKQITNGTTKLSVGVGGEQQLTDIWIQNVLDKLDKSSPAYKAIDTALNNGTLVKGVAGVDRVTGKLTILRVK